MTSGHLFTQGLPDNLNPSHGLDTQNGERFYIPEELTFPVTREQSTNTAGAKNPCQKEPRRKHRSNSPRGTRDREGYWLPGTEIDERRAASRSRSSTSTTTSTESNRAADHQFDNLYHYADTVTPAKHRGGWKYPEEPKRRRHYNNRSPRGYCSSPPPYSAVGARKTKYTPEKKRWQDNNTHGSYSSDTRSNGSTGSTLRSRGPDFGAIQRHPLRNKQYKQPFCSGPYGRDYYDLEGNKIDFSRYRPEHFDLPHKHNYIGWSTEDIYARIREVNTQIYTLTEELGLLHSMTPRKETYPNRNVDMVNPPRW